MRIAILAAATALAVTPAFAEWTRDAETCASHPDAVTVEAACTRALDSGVLDTEERARTLSNRAWAHLELGNNIAARVDLESSISIHPEGGRASAWNLLGIVHEKLGEDREAELAYLKALDQLARQGGENISAGASTDIAATGNLAYLYDRTGQREKAADWTGRAHRIDPASPRMQALYQKYGLR